MEQIETVTLDLDGTLLEYDRSPAELLQISFERLEMDPIFAVEEYYARYDEFATQYDSIDELRSACFATLAAENGHERALGRELAAVYSKERDHSKVELLPSVPQVLDELSQRYQLAIITNGAQDSQQEKIDATGLDRWIETITVAGHDTAAKPDTEPFERTLRLLDGTPSKTVHVGDSLDTDIAGASAAGIDSVWISETAGETDYSPTHRIATPSELLSIL